MSDCIFCRIAKKEMDTKLEYEDEKVVAFKDLHPKAPVHLLIIPKEHTSEFFYLQDESVLQSVRKAALELIKTYDLSGRGYKIELNGGGAQLVDHLHSHLLGPISKPLA